MSPSDDGKTEKPAVIAHREHLRSEQIIFTRYDQNRNSEKNYLWCPIPRTMVGQIEKHLTLIHSIHNTASVRDRKFRGTREPSCLFNQKLETVYWDVHVDDDNPPDAKIHDMEIIRVCNMQHSQARTHSAHQKLIPAFS